MMVNQLLRTGISGTIVTSTCRFTPFLVWPLSVAGLVLLMSYFDTVPLTPLALSEVLLTVGLAVALRDKNL